MHIEKLKSQRETHSILSQKKKRESFVATFIFSNFDLCREIVSHLSETQKKLLGIEQSNR